MREEDCIFCKIAAGLVPADIVYQDEEVVAFRDREPMAPTHVIIIPRSHISSLTALGPEHRGVVWHMVSAANKVAKKEGLAQRGYRLTVNCGREGGQFVPHLHMHLLGGRTLTDAMG
jgi:histidine triad (HIT) family protein